MIPKYLHDQPGKINQSSTKPQWEVETFLVFRIVNDFHLLAGIWAYVVYNWLYCKDKLQLVTFMLFHMDTNAACVFIGTQCWQRMLSFFC